MGRPESSVEKLSRRAAREPANLRRRKKHTCDQDAECDVIETLRENMHGVALTTRKDSAPGASECDRSRDRTPLPAADCSSRISSALLVGKLFHIRGFYFCVDAKSLS